MDTIWLSKIKWETVWAALHNIAIRQDFTVKTPSATVSGSGTGARLHLDLPAAGTGGGGGAVEIGVITSVSSIGAGLATYKRVTVDKNGAITAVGQDIPCVIPAIYHFSVDS